YDISAHYLFLIHALLLHNGISFWDNHTGAQVLLTVVEGRPVLQAAFHPNHGKTYFTRLISRM
ncbi:MAG: hypothetical protein VX555_08095, partial [Pseudomonadota bacterium]|nr:hypothetical protein [Pseudomonadota bacterium]